MPVNGDIFKSGMARLGAAVSVVTTGGGAGRSGLTVTAVCSVTDTPPMLLVCVHRNSRSLETIRANGNLAVNVLRSCHENIAGRFSDGGCSMDERFAAGEWGRRATGAPILTDALVSFDCRLEQTASVGSHDILYCAVADIAMHDDANGLFYFSRNFCRLASGDLHPLAH